MLADLGQLGAGAEGGLLRALIMLVEAVQVVERDKHVVGHDDGRGRVGGADRPQRATLRRDRAHQTGELLLRPGRSMRKGRKRRLPDQLWHPWSSPTGACQTVELEDAHITLRFLSTHVGV